MSSEPFEQIRRLKARYFRCIDTKDWVGLRDVLCEDVEIDVAADSGRRYSGADAFVASVQRVLSDAVSVHHGHMPEIELTSPTTATGIWSMEDELWFPEGAPVRYLHGYGHYYETYHLDADGSWRIASMRLERLRRDVLPNPDPSPAE